jgi:hypothetical protein
MPTGGKRGGKDSADSAVDAYRPGGAGPRTETKTSDGERAPDERHESVPGLRNQEHVEIAMVPPCPSWPHVTMASAFFDLLVVVRFKPASCASSLQQRHEASFTPHSEP